MAGKRYDKNRKLLKEGEDYREDTDSYSFRKMIDGERVNLVAKTLDELRKKEEEWQKQRLLGARNADANTTLNDVYEVFKNVKRGIKDNTADNYKYSYEHYVQPVFGKTRLAKIKKSDVRAFYNHLNEKKLIGISTIDSVHTVLHQVLQLAVDDGLIFNNPSDEALKELKKALGGKKKGRFALSHKAENAFMNYLEKTKKERKWFLVFTIFDEHGPRIGEVGALRWENVDFEKKEITICENLTYCKRKNGQLKYSLDTPKTVAGSRTLPMTKKSELALRELKKLHDSQNLKSSVSIDGKTDFVFLNKCNRPLNQQNVNKAIRRIVDDANEDLMNQGKEPIIPYFTTHVLRHTFITRLIEAKIDIKSVQYLAGHKDIKTTLDIYAEATKETVKVSMKDFEKLKQKYNNDCTNCTNSVPKIHYSIKSYKDLRKKVKGKIAS